MRTDHEWIEAAARYRRAEWAAKLADDEKTAAREALMALAGGENAAGHGVSVTYQQRKGAIDYRAIADSLLTPDLQEEYRKDGTVAVVIKVEKEG